MLRVPLILLLVPTAVGAQQCELPAVPYFEFQVTAPAAWIPDSTIATHPVPPVRGAVRGELDALVQFVVDTAGVPDPASFKVLAARDEALATAGREAVLRWRYRPARMGTCPVPQIVQTPLGRR
jgi:hypothetical protein